MATLANLESFVSSADLGSFSAAARRLALTPAAVSRNVAMLEGLCGAPLNAACSASKGAVTLLTKSAAKEFSGLEYPIRVNSVHPGVVETPMIDSIVRRYVEAGFYVSMAKAKEDFVSRTPGRYPWMAPLDRRSATRPCRRQSVR